MMFCTNSNIYVDCNAGCYGKMIEEVGIIKFLGLLINSNFSYKIYVEYVVPNLS
jgi:hypothetical protein